MQKKKKIVELAHGNLYNGTYPSSLIKKLYISHIYANIHSKFRSQCLCTRLCLLFVGLALKLFAHLLKSTDLYTSSTECEKQPFICTHAPVYKVTPKHTTGGTDRQTFQPGGGACNSLIIGFLRMWSALWLRKISQLRTFNKRHSVA